MHAVFRRPCPKWVNLKCGAPFSEAQDRYRGRDPQVKYLRLTVALVIGGLGGWALSSWHVPEPQPPAVYAESGISSVDLNAEETRNISIFEEASPSVVFITSVAQNRNPFSLDVMNVPAGTGSGLIWDEEGHVVTNFHVIRQANSATVTLADQSSWPAELVGVAPDKDIAVLKINAPAEKLRPLRMGSSADLRVGQSVYAIGNPFGLDQTLTTGIISGLGREIQSVTRRPILDVIQTDAAINPGNSGGPLLDSSGRMIGINTAIFSPSGASSGVGFAVPIDSVKRIVPQLIDNGHARRPGIGVILGPDHLARRLGMSGVIVAGVAPGTPAASAGFQVAYADRRGRIVLGDVITHVDGEPVETSNDLYILLEEHAPGDEVTVTVLRQGETVDMDVELIDLAAI